MESPSSREPAWTPMVFENYEDGMSVDELHYQFGVDKGKIRAVLAYAAMKQQTMAL